MASQKATPKPVEHTYHAEAFALQGDLQLPVKTTVKPQTYVKLSESGGYLSERASDYRLEGVFSFHRAYTQVSGHPDCKKGHGYVTLATSVIEGFNVLDVVTADRIVAQVSTEHPLYGYVPEVTFLGTRFENLRIAGHPVTVDLDTELFGGKPKKDAPHSRGDFGDYAAKQRKKLLGLPKLPPRLRNGTIRLHPNLQLKGRSNARWCTRRRVLSWAFVWPRDRHTAFRQSLSRHRAAGRVRPAPERGYAEADADRADDDRGEDGLHRGRQRLGGSTIVNGKGKGTG